MSVAELHTTLPAQVLLLEAYEQLEADVGKEVDRALGRQADELTRLQRRVTHLEGALGTERGQVALLGEQAARLEGELSDATARNARYEAGVYGLPQARAPGASPEPAPPRSSIRGVRVCVATWRRAVRAVQAVLEIKALKEEVASGQGRVQELVQQVGRLPGARRGAAACCGAC